MSRTAVITGGSNGIGKEVALMMAREGIIILINYFSDEASANRIILEAERVGSKAFAVKADMGTMKGVESVYEAAINSLGHIDILFNNAGVFIENDFIHATEESYDRTMNVIAKGSFFLTQMIVKHMIENGIKGRIVNTSSSVTKDPKQIPVDYCMAKASINNFTKAVASQIGIYGITCNAILPGAIPTNINKWQFDIPELREKFIEGSVMKQLGDTKYIAEAVKYFISDNAKWTTGALLSVDGGYTI